MDTCCLTHNSGEYGIAAHDIGSDDKRMWMGNVNAAREKSCRRSTRMPEMEYKSRGVQDTCLLRRVSVCKYNLGTSCFLNARSVTRVSGIFVYSHFCPCNSFKPLQRSKVYMSLMTWNDCKGKTVRTKDKRIWWEPGSSP